MSSSLCVSPLFTKVMVLSKATLSDVQFKHWWKIIHQKYDETNMIYGVSHEQWWCVVGMASFGTTVDWHVCDSVVMKSPWPQQIIFILCGGGQITGTWKQTSRNKTQNPLLQWHSHSNYFIIYSVDYLSSNTMFNNWMDVLKYCTVEISAFDNSSMFLYLNEDEWCVGNTCYYESFILKTEWTVCSQRKTTK